ncbi:hypothetical protein [Halovulum sp. GXIMD14793]
MLRPFIFLALSGALVACDNSEPAGGHGPFDPPPPVRVNSPIFAGNQFGVQLPPSQRTPQQDSEALAQDVTTTLNSTQPQGQPRSVVQPSAQTVNGGRDIGIDPNDTSIDLNASSQETQKRQREAAAQIREENRQKLVVINPEPVPNVNVNANVIKFARETTHPKGTKVYNRPSFRDRLQSASVCRRFKTNDEAQRQFLANGGPTTDRYNLDPDGDGFACNFDPEGYRKLQF